MTHLDIDALFAQGIKHLRAEAAAKEAKAKAPRRVVEAPADKPSASLYTDPLNWTRLRGVALIHEETSTVLGNFSEYAHRSEPGTTKLIREELPILVSETRRVSGSWYLERARKPEPQKPWHEKRTVIVHLHLGELRLHAPVCEVVVFLQYGGIDRVELAVDTMFAAEEGAQEQLLFLPAGTNVREVTSLDCKMAIRKELGI